MSAVFSPPCGGILSLTASIIIPNYNGASLLPNCLNALAAQTHPATEVIVVDDGSSDESISLINHTYSWVTLVESVENQGFIKAMNTGFRLAQSDIVVALNNDTEVSPTWLAALIHAFEQHPEAGFAASKLRLFDQREVLHAAGDSFGKDGIPINRGVWQEDKGQFDQDEFIFGACGGAVAYRRSMLAEVGFYDEDLFMYCEDVDLNWRAQLAGYRCVFVPQAIVYHHLSATGGGVLASYYTGRNTILVLAKSVPTVIWQKHFFEIVTAQLRIAIEALKAWRGEAARARLRGQLAGLINIPFWLTKRGPIQAKKRVSDDYIESLLQ